MVWDACLNTHEFILHWMECHPGTAAYVQAIGVVLTIAGAVFGPGIKGIWSRYRVRRQNERDANARAKFAIVDVELVIGRVDELLDAVPSVATQATLPSINPLMISIPQTIFGSFGEPRISGPGVLNAIFDLGGLLGRYNGMLMNMTQSPATNTPQALTDCMLLELPCIKARAIDVRYMIYAIDVPN